MTTYAYTITLTDNEVVMLQEALINMVKKCSEMMPDGPKAPYFAHMISAEQVLRRLYSNMHQTSWNNFGEDI